MLELDGLPTSRALGRVVALMAALIAAIGVSPAASAGETYSAGGFGFRLEVPDGWTARVDSESNHALHVTFSPPAAAGLAAQLSVRARIDAVRDDPRAVQDETMRTIEAGAEYADGRRLEDTLLDRPSPGVITDMSTPSGTFRVRQRYLVQDGVVYVLQGAAAPAQWELVLPLFDEVWSGFKLTPLDETRAAEVRLLALAGRCGSEVDWAGDWDEAAARAHEQHRLVLVSARFYPGFDISDGTMTGPFMDHDIIELVNERFVPLRIEGGTQVPFSDPELFGMGASTFGTALMLVTPDGEVLFQTEDVFYEALLAGLDVSPRASNIPRGLSTVEQAQARLARGQLERAETLLTEVLLRDADDVEALSLLASIRRRQRDGVGALAVLDRALEADAAGTRAVELEDTRARVLVGLGRNEEAAEIVARLLDEHPGHELEPALLYVHAILAWGEHGKHAAEPVLRRLVEQFSDTRWSWMAAATLTSTAWQIDFGAARPWPAAELYAAALPPESAPLPASSAKQTRRAKRQAVVWLLDNQEGSGAWQGPNDWALESPDDHEDFKLAIGALGVRALLRVADQPDVEPALQRAIDWVLLAHDRALADGGPVAYMDYAVWSQSYVLWMLADLVNAGRLDPADIDARVAGLLDALAERQRSNGGWSYFLTAELGAGDGPEQSISFTTAAATMALLEARDAGIAIREPMLARALDCLEAMRLEDGRFTYMLYANTPAATASSAAPGAAGRGPLCTLALQRAGRLEFEDVMAALGTFLEHLDTYVSERGKVLMHTGAAAQGSHYLMFDYANAAFAGVAAPAHGIRAHHDGPLKRAVLDARTADGAFLDTLLLGKSYGTAMAVLALDDLGVRD